MNKWTQEQDAQLRDLWPRVHIHWSAISAVVGRSKGSIISRARALGLPPRIKLKEKERRVEAVKKAKGANAHEYRAVPKLTALYKDIKWEDAPDTAIHILNVSNGQCRYPYDGGMCCGVATGSPLKQYCPEHASRCLVSIK